MTTFLIPLFLCLSAQLLNAACVRDTYASLPPLPTFPSTAYTGTVAAANTYVQNHWSEMAQIGNYRPTNTIVSSQTSCPHLNAGLVDWHDPATWGGSVPGNGAAVTIPAGKSVLLSSCSVDPSFVFGLITIPVGAKLIFGDANINISATGFRVDGQLLMGSPTCRLRSKIAITLYGKRSNQALPAAEYVKGIYVDGGLDMHSVEYFPTWTRLAATAVAGDTVIFIQDCPNWQPGQNIAIITTELKDTRDWQRNEERTIAAVYTTSISSNTCAVRLTAALTYTHYGGFEYQAEVALLTRNILVQGDAVNSEPTDITPIACKYPNSAHPSTYPCEDKFLTGFGAHILMTVPATFGRLSGVEVFRGGQTNVMGRYPIHFHMLGNLTTPNIFWASDCSVHRSYFRCFTIHGTSGALTTNNGVTLTKNTGFDVIGHCFFASEDGVEENNTLSYNLAAHIHPLGPFWQTAYDITMGAFSSGSQSFGSQNTAWITGGPANPNLALADDVGASPFYITNAYVRLIGNAASGGWSGFSFPNLPKAVGLHQYAQNYFCPMNRPLLQFAGNSAHSTGFWQEHAAGVYLGGNLHYDDNGNYIYTTGRDISRDTCRDYRQGSSVQINWQCIEQDRLWMQFLDTKVFLANVGLQSWGDREELIRFEVHDVTVATNVFGEVWLDQMLVSCRSKNTPFKFSGCTDTNAWNCNGPDRQFFWSFGGFQFYDTFQSHIVTNSVFKNCKPQNPNCVNGGNCSMYIFLYLTHSDQFTPGLMQATRNITYGVVDRGYLTVPSTDIADGVTVSGRDANWVDYDGTVTGLFPGQRTNIGSNWAGADWWRYNSNCVNQQNNWICGLQPGDSSASMMIHWDRTQEDQVGNSVCSNGQHISCPIGGHVAHFGRTHPAGAFELAAMPRVTGPIIASQGGWYVHFIAGTPKLLTIDQIQVRKTDLLHLAVPYPAGTTFSVYAKSRSCSPCAAPVASWCPVCVHYYQAASSIAAVRNGYGDDYFYDSSTQLLHFRVMDLDSSFSSWPFFSNQSNILLRWNAQTPSANRMFSRGGVDLLVVGGDEISINVEVTSSNCNPRCAAITPAVPPAMPITPVPTVAPTRQPTSLAPSSQPTSAAPTLQPTAQPTPQPTSLAPTKFPTSLAPTLNPTAMPTPAPTSLAPTPAPTSLAPTPAPTSKAPTANPTTNPTPSPTASPTSLAPTANPTLAPTTRAPSAAPSFGPTAQPTNQPTGLPTSLAPSLSPTVGPTPAPSEAPTRQPSQAPTNQPSAAPTSTAPTQAPTQTPTNFPTGNPTSVPTDFPSPAPSNAPTAFPTSNPTAAPTPMPTSNPTAAPTPFPSAAPTGAPTNQPLGSPPTEQPTPFPTAMPTGAPTNFPTGNPTPAPTSFPTGNPTAAPTEHPTQMPTGAPTAFPTSGPTAVPTDHPTTQPTPAPTPVPSGTPTSLPTDSPTALPTVFVPAPTVEPTETPTWGKCWNLSTMCNKYNQEIGSLLLKWNQHPSMLNYPITALGHCDGNGNSFTFSLVIGLGPLQAVEIAKICDAVSDGVAADFAAPKRCYYFNCDSSKKRVSDASSTTLSVSMSDSDSASSNSGSVPTWVYIIAAAGACLIIIALLLVVIMLVMKKSKTPEWQKYENSDRYFNI